MSRRSYPRLSHMKYSRGGGIQRDTHKGGNGYKTQAMGDSHYFIFHKVDLIGISDHCVKK